MPAAQATLGSDTKLKLGLAIVLAGVVWWGATMQAKLDEVLNRANEISQAYTTLMLRVSDLDARVQVLEAKVVHAKLKK